jgi:hypothetical protein
MADATTIIRNLGQQVALLIVDKAILEVEVADLRTRLGEGEGALVELGDVEEVPDLQPPAPSGACDTMDS